MSYFTERHGLRKPIERTYDISIEMYSLLFQCCEKYLNNIASLLPDECPDGRGCCGVDYKQLNVRLKFEIPTLYRDMHENISVPPENYKLPWDENDDVLDYDPFALLDYIEFIAQNMKDVEKADFHSFFGHYHLNLLGTNKVFFDFKIEINDIFNKIGLLYTLTDDKIVERVVENSPLTQEIVSNISQVSEVGTKELLKDAIDLYKTPGPAARQDSVEKIWDALERLKTYYTALNKKDSVSKIVEDMGNGQAEFMAIFDEEFKALTKIGNDYRIRHHETNKIDITDVKHYDYFFNRCLSLIGLAIQYLQ